VDGLWQRFVTAADSPFALNDLTLLLPTNRACRAVRAGFLHRAGARATLLPRMMPLGELDEEPLFFEGAAGPGGGIDLPLMPIGALNRQWHLAHLLQIAQPDTPAPQRFRLAAELGRLLDQWQTEELDTSLLATLPEERFASHWQQTMQVLAVILEHWPALLAEKNLCDPAQHRNMLMAAQAALWQRFPSGGPVIAAGSTGSMPATARLLAAIAALPKGEIILPGLDRIMPDQAWDAVDEQHPQFMLKRVLGHLNQQRADIMDWPGRPPVVVGAITTPQERQMRMALLSWAMLPAATGDLWQSDAVRNLNLPMALRGVTRIDAAHPEEEAQIIALIMRQTLEEPERRAILVTPDRQLARRVAAMMARWGIMLDDSAGVPLSETALGSWLRLTARFALTPARYRRAVDLLALLKHPLAGLGRMPGDRLALVRLLEIRVLRQGCRHVGWDRLRRFIAALDDPEQKYTLLLLALIDDLAAAFAPLEQMLADGASAADMVRAHGRVAEQLATDHDQKMDLWAGIAGEAAAGFFSSLLQTLETGGARLAPDDYPDILDDWLRNVPVRQHYGGDPRLGIRGPLEARLQQADVVILAGLNEGSWPNLPAPDAWLSRAMRHQLALPTAERRIGQSAHDFIAACGAEQIFLTRAERQGGAPTVSSRWLQRLDTIIRIIKPDGPSPWLAGQALWLARVRGLDQSAKSTPVACPAPVPPLALRPQTISISDIGLLLENPYEFYAARILKLSPLDPLEAPLGANERGSRIHALFEKIMTAWRDSRATLWDQPWHDRLVEAAADIFDDLADDPVVRGFWQPALAKILADYSQWQQEQAALWGVSALEIPGFLSYEQDGQKLRIKGRADRVDYCRAAPEQMMIIDYKTGTVPSVKDILESRKPQLGLLALMLARDGFRPAIAPNAVPANLCYLGIGTAFKSVMPKDGCKPQLIDDVDAGLDGIVRHLFDPAAGFVATAHGFGAFHHLARLDEWAVAGDDSDDDGAEA